MTPDSCTSLHRIETLERKEDVVFTAIKKMEDKFDAKLDLILFQIQKIAVLEANHQNHQAGMARAFDKIEYLESQARDLQAFKNHTSGMAKMAWVLWSALGISVAGLLVKVLGT